MTANGVIIRILKTLSHYYLPKTWIQYRYRLHRYVLRRTRYAYFNYAKGNNSRISEFWRNYYDIDTYLQ